MRHAIIALLAALLMALPAQGQEQEPQVLYCVDKYAAERSLSKAGPSRP